jgi:hypothetical protein
MLRRPLHHIHRSFSQTRALAPLSVDSLTFQEALVVTRLVVDA